MPRKCTTSAITKRLSWSSMTSQSSRSSCGSAHEVVTPAAAASSLADHAAQKGAARQSGRLRYPGARTAAAAKCVAMRSKRSAAPRSRARRSQKAEGAHSHGRCSHHDALLLWAASLHPPHRPDDGVCDLAELVILFPVVIERHGAVGLALPGVAALRPHACTQCAEGGASGLTIVSPLQQHEGEAPMHVDVGSWDGECTC